MSDYQPIDNSRTVAFSHDGLIVYTSTNGSNVVNAHSVDSGALLASYTIGSTLGGMVVTRDGRYLFAAEQVAEGSAILHRLDLATGTITDFSTPASSPGAGFYDVATLSATTLLLSQANGSTSGPLPLITFDLASGAFGRSPASYDTLARIFPSSDGDGAFALDLGFSSPSQDLLRIDGQGRIVATAPALTGSTPGPIDALAGSVVGDIVLRNTGTALLRYDSDLQLRGDILPTLQAQMGVGSAAGLAFSEDGSRFFLLNDVTTLIYEFTVANLQLVRAFPSNIGRVFNQNMLPIGDTLTLSPGGRFVGVLNDGQFGVIELARAVSINGGTGDDTLVGTDQPDAIFGGLGNDRLERGPIGTGTSDVLVGGAGDDTYVVDDYTSSVRIVELAGGGTDTIITQAGFVAPPANVEIVRFAAGASGTLQGNGSTTLIGGDLADTLINGGTMIGGRGNDSYQGRTAVINASAAQSTIDLAIYIRTRFGYQLFGESILTSEDGVDSVNVDIIQFRDAELNAGVAIWVNTFYQTLFGRDVTLAEALAIDADATTLPGILAQIVNSSVGGPMIDARVDGYYQQYFGRAATSAELSAWRADFSTVDIMTQGTPYARLTAALLADPVGQAYTRAAISANYEELLGRAATEREITAWQSEFAGPFGRTITGASGSLRSTLLATDESTAYVAATLASIYAAEAERSPSADESAVAMQALLADASFADIRVDLLYREYFGRTAQPGELAAWDDAFAGGATFATVRQALLDEPVGQSHVAEQVGALYEAYFARPATDAETANWIAAISDGSTYADVRTALLSEPLANTVVRTEVSEIYQEYGGRPASAGEQDAWVDAIRGGATFDTVRGAVVDSTFGQTYLNTEITDLYDAIFGRAPAARELRVWKDEFRDGTLLDTLLDTLLSDPGSAQTGVRALDATPGADTFTYRVEFNDAVIEGFTPGQDRISYRASGLGSFDPLDAAHARQLYALDGTPDVLLTPTDGDNILLHNVLLSQLSSADFLI